jgi:citrate synthase
VAASVRADPYAVVTAGLATVSGALHGGASLGAEALLDAVADPAGAGDAIGLRLRRGERIPGFGHTVYKSGDGRAGVLLDRVRAAAPDHPVLLTAQALLDAARRRKLPEPNIDFALATLTKAAGLPTGAGEAIFAIARIAGWLAHAMEEYERRTPLRLRAVYIGADG